MQSEHSHSFSLPSQRTYPLVFYPIFLSHLAQEGGHSLASSQKYSSTPAFGFSQARDYQTPLSTYDIYIKLIFFLTLSPTLLGAQLTDPYIFGHSRLERDNLFNVRELSLIHI